MESVSVERWDHLGVVASVIKDLGLIEMIDACLGLQLHTGALTTPGTHLRRDTVIPQWVQASKAAAASDGHAVHC
jgi:hypothetical protein